MARSVPLLGLCLLGFALSGCGHLRSSSTGGGLLNTKGEGGLVNTAARSPTEVAAEAVTGSSDKSLDGEVHGVKLRNRNFDIPIVYNDEVEQWLDYFTGPGRKHFQVYLERKARIEPIIVPKLKAGGVPQDLLYLSMIESGFSTSAYSHAGASGPWQFIRSTGRLFGLQSNWWVDERRDPLARQPRRAPLGQGPPGPFGMTEMERRGKKAHCDEAKGNEKRREREGKA